MDEDDKLWPKMQIFKWSCLNVHDNFGLKFGPCFQLWLHIEVTWKATKMHVPGFITRDSDLTGLKAWATGFLMLST